jgi:hypothetical protein
LWRRGGRLPGGSDRGRGSPQVIEVEPFQGLSGRGRPRSRGLVGEEANGRGVRVPEGFDLEYLSRLLAVPEPYWPRLIN